MTFNSLSFLTFFAIVVVVYYALPAWQARKAWIVGASFAFYGAWNVRYLFLFLAALTMSYAAGNWIHATTDPVQRKRRLALAVTVLVAGLAVFKFSGLLELGLVLPLGISFYVFQAIAYLVDVYRRTSAPAASPLDYALYFAFFPHLGMGPIVRPNEFLPQCAAPPAFSSARFFTGLSMITLGLFAKVVLADDVLSPVADSAFAAAGAGGSIEAWTGAVTYTCGLFFDFSGYTSVALGAAHCLGFTLPGNFNLPFGAIGFNDFWRRWHVSLSRWIRDYLYVPLSTRLIMTTRSWLGREIYMRVRPLVALVAAITTMALAGLWHGVHLVMVMWGLVHAFYLIVEHLAVRRRGLRAWGTSRAVQAFLLVLTFVLVCISMTIFNAADVGQALHMLKAMFTGTPSTAFLGIRPGHAVLTSDVCIAWSVAAVTVATHAALRKTTFMAFWGARAPILRALALGVMLALLAIADSAHSVFAYMQF